MTQKKQRLITAIMLLPLSLAFFSVSSASDLSFAIAIEDKCSEGEIPCTCNGSASCVSSVLECWNSCLVIDVNTTLDEIHVVPATADGRFTMWKAALRQFTENHADMTDRQAKALLNAIELTESALFQDNLSPLGQDTLRRVLDGLADSFPASDYKKILANTKGLEEWLISNNLGDALFLPGCNCNDDDDCSGSCSAASSCKSGENSLAWGICASGGPQVE